MRKKDIAIIGLVVFVSAIISFIISSKLFSSPKDRQQKVEVVEPISADFKRPDERYFNKNSVDPTQTIQIGDSTNSKPFSGQ